VKCGTGILPVISERHGQDARATFLTVHRQTVKTEVLAIGMAAL
jgi:hypothetical protein